MKEHRLVWKIEKWCREVEKRAMPVSKSSEGRLTPEGRWSEWKEATPDTKEALEACVPMGEGRTPKKEITQAIVS